MLVFPGEDRNLLDLGGGHITRINSTDASPLDMYFEHDLHCLFSVHGKKPLQHKNNKLHWREIVVEQQYGVKRRRRGLAAFSLEYGTFLLLSMCIRDSMMIDT